MLPILKYPDPILLQISSPVNDFNEEIIQLGKEMLGTMKGSHGVGLAAPQIGKSIRMFVFNPWPFNPVSKDYVCINPTILEKSEDLGEEDEGCLSVPDRHYLVSRPILIKVSYYNNKGKEQIEMLGGFKARIFQHEYDHLDGILINNRG